MWKQIVESRQLDWLISWISAEAAFLGRFLPKLEPRPRAGAFFSLEFKPVGRPQCQRGRDPTGHGRHRRRPAGEVPAARRAGMALISKSRGRIPIFSVWNWLMPLVRRLSCFRHQAIHFLHCTQSFSHLPQRRPTADRGNHNLPMDERQKTVSYESCQPPVDGEDAGLGR